ncbi:hypothetical protein PFISCL1PPCAC_21883, partial [Pristionchus fissidentatus]
MAEFKCSRYHSSKIFKTSLGRILDRFREVYDKCEFGALKLEISRDSHMTIYREIIESCTKIPCTDLFVIEFPILDLPHDLSAKILSYLGSRELAFCLQSLALDKVHAEWNKDQTIEYMDITVNASDFGNETYFREFIELCIGIRCTYLFYIQSADKFTDKDLREMLSNKKDIKIGMRSDEITPAGLFAVWEDLLDGKFDGLSIRVNKSVANELFDRIRRKSLNKYYSLSQAEGYGRVDRSKRYEIWRDSSKNAIGMSRIYDDRPWESKKYSN